MEHLKLLIWIWILIADDWRTESWCEYLLVFDLFLNALKQMKIWLLSPKKQENIFKTFFSLAKMVRNSVSTCAMKGFKIFVINNQFIFSYTFLHYLNNSSQPSGIKFSNLLQQIVVMSNKFQFSSSLRWPLYELPFSILSPT